MGTIRSVSTRGRSLDGVDSSSDKTTITTIPTVGVYSSSDKRAIATFPAFLNDLQSASPLDMRPRIRVSAVGTNMLLYISVSLRTRQDTISYSLVQRVSTVYRIWGRLEESCGEIRGEDFEKRLAIVFYYFWSVGPSPKTPPQAN